MLAIYNLLIMLQIVHARTMQEIENVRKLFLEYQRWLGHDLTFQHFDTELAELPGKYAPPTGCLLLAVYENKPIGCVALRKLKESICEMKRLFVRTEHRNLGAGRALVEAIISEAKKLGYAKMRLDTLPSMQRAITLYKSLGFKEIESYYDTPIEGTVFMELDLKQITNDLTI